MKKMILPVLLAGSLFALSGATTATVAVAEPATVAATPIVADSGAVLTVDTVTVDTVAAPVVPAPEVSAPVAPVAVPVESVAPVVAPEPVTAPVVAPVAPVAVTAPVAPVAPAATAPVAGSTADTVPANPSSLKLGDAWAGAGTYYAGTTPTVAPVVAPVAAQADTYPAPLPEVTCMEDMPCWDCATMGNKICGNPACAAQNLFTVANQQCDRTPYGWTLEDSITDAKSTLAANGLDPAHFIYQGSQKAEAPRADGYKFVPAGIKGMVHLYLEIR